MSGRNTSQARGKSRREFLRTSGAVVAASTLAGTLAVPRGVHAGADETIRVGLIGCGGRGTGAASQALSTKGPVKLVAMGDAFHYRLQGSLNKLKKTFGDKVDVPPERQFVGLDAYRKVIDAGVDLVILTTPPGFRPLHFEAAVKAGKHVFMEKPVATDAAGVRRLLKANQLAKKKNLAVGVGLQRHHQNTYRETIKRLHDGMIGQIHTLRVYWNGAGVWVRPRDPKKYPEVKTDMQYQVNNWYYFVWLSGDHIVEQHIHNIDVGMWVKQGVPIVWCQGMGGRQVRKGPDHGEIYDHHAVEFQFADGTRMFSYCRHIPNCWNSVSEHAQGTKGTAEISAARIEVPGQTRWRYRGPRNNPYQTEHDDLFAAIRAGTPYNEGDFGAMSTMAAIMGRMATYSGKAITWDQAFNAPRLTQHWPDVDNLTWETSPPVPQVAVPGVTDVGIG